MSDAATSSNSLDTFDPRMIARPHTFYAQLRDHAPILWIEQLNGFLLTRYDDVRSVLRDHEQWSSARGDELARRINNRDVPIETVFPPGTLHMLSSDRPDHTRLRKIHALDFTPGKIGYMGPRINEIVSRLLAGISTKPTFDVAEELAVPLPVTVIAELLGIPPELGTQFKRWSDAATEPLHPQATAAEILTRNAEIVAFRSYMQARIAERHKHPTDDFIGRLVNAREVEGKLTDNEVLAGVNLLLLAGNETTTNLISNAALALCKFPQRQRELREHPELVDAAVEEFLRYDGSVQFTTRIATRDALFHGKTVKAGQVVIVCIASANRDERVFPNPDTLDFHRDAGRHIAFGDWIHICLGQFLARMETKAALLGLLNALPQFELAIPEEEIPYRPNFNLRGPKHLPIRIARS